ncbi:MAG: cobalt ABC transporter permease [Enterobacteriaceae bacterium]
MAEAPKIFNLERFEYLVNINAQEEACNELLFLLGQVDNFYGQWGNNITANTKGLTANQINRRICTRLAGAITELFARPDFALTDDGFVRLMLYYRWLAMIFAVSGYGHADHIIFSHNIAGGGRTDSLTLNENTFKIFCLSYYPDSQIELQLDELWNYDWKHTVVLLFCLLSCRALPTQAGHDKREKILAWLPKAMKSLETTDFLPIPLLHEGYMFSSYADIPGKHGMKKQLNRLIRNTLIKLGYKDVTTPPPVREKPLAFIILEWFNSRHSLYRTHSISLRALGEKYTLCAIGVETMLDDKTRQLFDDVHLFDRNEVFNKAIVLAQQQRPDLVYYISVGMFQHTVYLSNLRLAPLQIASYGHAASMFSTQLDAFMAEEDMVGDLACFGERVAALPVGSIPYVDLNLIEPLPTRQIESSANRDPHKPVRVAVPAAIMKINPGFLHTLRQIEERSRVPVQFCFYMVSSVGIIHDYMSSAIKEILPDAEVNTQFTLPEYLQRMCSCDLFANPFPYGNTNSLVDVVALHIPGVCMNGPEIHTRIDAALFARMGMPAELTANTPEEYIKGALHLIKDHPWREMLQRKLAAEKPEQVLYNGRPELFAEAVLALQHEKSEQGDAMPEERLVRPVQLNQDYAGKNQDRGL